MAEVGVLNLEIQSNADGAAQSLGQLATKLGSVKKNASGFDLSNVSANIKNIVDAVKGSEKTMSSLGTLLNSVGTYFKTFKNIKKEVEEATKGTGDATKGAILNLAPIKELKEILGDGLKLGNAGSQLSQLRTALSGEWNTGNIETIGNALSTIANGAKGVDTANLGEVATNVSAVAKALSEYADAAAKVKDAVGVGGGSNSGQVGSNMSLGSSGLKMGLQFFGGKGETNATEQMKMDLEGLMQTVQSVTQQLTENTAQVQSTMQSSVGVTDAQVQATASVADQEQMVTAQLEEQVRLRHEAMQAAEQSRLESNYGNFRELFMSGEGDWKQTVPNMFGLTPESIQQYETYAEALAATMQEVNEYVDRFVESMNQPAGSLLSDVIDADFASKLSGEDAQGAATFLDKALAQEEAVQRVESAVQRMGSSFDGVSQKTTVLTDDLTDLDSELQSKQGDLAGVADAAQETSRSFSEIMFGAQGLNGAFTRMFPTLAGLTKRFAGMAKMRAMRYMIRQIAAGFSEGVQNMYRYSQAIGSSLAPAMDTAVSSLGQMKNSIGAAAAPIISALVPALQTVIGWLVSAINLLNQFFSLLGGATSWTKAVYKQADAYDKVKKSAGGAGGAVKDLLADWDELNIIQSQGGGGGGGGGGGLADDYASMFEEVKEFEGWIKDLVDGINEQFGDIWGLVKRIGAVILGWKISNAFQGVIGTLGGLLAALGMVDLEWNISVMLNNKYFDTGEIGWLIADVLQALIGGVLMQKILGKVLAGQYAYLGIPIMLAVNATARLFTFLGRSDVSALSKEGLISNVTSALELGGVAAYLAKMAGGSLGESLAGGAAVALFTFGVVTNIKATLEAAKEGEITDDIVKAAALGSVAIGLSGGIAAKLLVPGVTGAQALGFGAATGAEALLFTMSAALGVVATIEAAESGITEGVLLKDIGSSLSMGLGSGFVVKMATAKSWVVSMAGGMGIGLATLSGLIGIQATIEAVKNEAITGDTIIKDAIASVAMMAGVTIIGKTIVGLGTGAALAAGGVGAVAVLTALLAVQAALVLAKGEDKVKWGNLNLTQQEAQDYVNANGFALDVPATISIIKEKIDTSKIKKSEIETDLTTALGDFNVIRLGVAEEDDYKKLKIDILGDEETNTKGLIDKISEYIGEAKSAGKLTLQFTPTLVGKNDEDAADWFESYTAGWGKVDEFASDRGRRIGELLDKGMKGALAEGEPELLAQLMQELSDVTEAMTKAKTNSSAFANLQMGLGDLSQAGFEEIKKAFTGYRDELRTEYEALVNEQYQLQGQLVAALFVIDPEGEEYRKAKEKYDEMGRNLVNAVNSSVEEAAAPGVEWLTNFLLEKYKNVLPDFDSILAEDFNPFSYLDFSEMSTDEIAGEIRTWLTEQISRFNQDLGGYISEIGLNPFMFLTDEVGGTKDKVIQYMNDIFGEELTQELLLKLNIDVSNETTESAKEAAEQVKETVKEATENVPKIETETPVDLGVDVESSTDSLKKEVKETVESATQNMEPVKVEAPVELEASVVVGSVIDNMQGGTSFKEAIEDAVADYGQDAVDTFMPAIIENLKKQWFYRPGMETTGSMGKPWRTTASGGMSDVNYGGMNRINRNDSANADEDLIDYNQMANSVQSGTSRANTNVISELQVIATRLSALLAKNWTVNINATSSLGAVNSAASAAWGKVTGP